jgi:endonuclease YncB( thermonuclease family)
MTTPKARRAHSPVRALHGRARRLATFLLAVVAFAGAADDATTGRVTHVADGDSIHVALDRGGEIEVRLAEVDAPEHGQPYGDEARAALRDLVADAQVSLAIQDVDRHGRIVARVHTARVDVCQEMVRVGAAWAYRQYLRDERLLALEAEARTAHRGLWQLPESQRIAPWEWRHAAQTRPPAPSTQAGVDCLIKGNVNSRGERIYHVPGQRYYRDTQISVANGERWFCTEDEARAAGWRRARP